MMAEALKTEGRKQSISGEKLNKFTITIYKAFVVLTTGYSSLYSNTLATLKLLTRTSIVALCLL